MEATFKELANIIFDGIIPKLEKNDGLAIFARNRSKFEGWLKVELCGILSRYFPTIIPEKEIDKDRKDKIDITFDNWAIELKTVNTNYRGYGNVVNKQRPITKNIKGIINDIEKLKTTNYVHKAVLFIVFPVTPDKKPWQNHLEKISKHLKKIEYREFKFKNNVPGIVYFGLIQ